MAQFKAKLTNTKNSLILGKNTPMGTLIDGKKIATAINRRTARRVRVLHQNGHTPHLGVILIGNNPASETYVRKKGEIAKTLGIDFTLFRFDTTTTEETILKKIKSIQRSKKISGLIIQLPVPKHLETTTLINAVQPEFDIDCLNESSIGRMVLGKNMFIPPTAGAILEIIASLGISVAGKDICLVGMGLLVGKPLSIILPNLKASITTCNSQTKNLKAKCLSADILISGVGKKNLIRGNMVKPGSIIIDAGVAIEDNKVFGDVNIEEVIKKAQAVTPTPGGVGPITIALLLYNTLLAAENRYQEK